MTKDARKWMPMFWKDYLADTGHLTPAQHGSYLLLIAYYWINGHLPRDEQIIRRIAKLSPANWKKQRDILAAFFEIDCVSTQWSHTRIDAELSYAIEKSRINSTNVSKRYSVRSSVVDTPNTQEGIERKKEANGHSRKKGPPRHMAYTKDRSRVYCKFGTPEWAQYADDYRDHHGGVDPPLVWDGDGSWFNWSGEAAH